MIGNMVQFYGPIGLALVFLCSQVIHHLKVKVAGHHLLMLYHCDVGYRPRIEF